MIATAVRAVELGSRSIIGRRSRILFQHGQQQGQQQFQGQGFQFQHVRYLNVHEYLSMSLLKENGINVPNGYIASTPEEAEDIFLNKLNKKGMLLFVLRYFLCTGRCVALRCIQQCRYALSLLVPLSFPPFSDVVCG